MTIPFNLSKFADYLNASGNANPLVASDQENTSTGSLGLPYGTTAQRPASPADGYTRINTTTNVLEVYYSGTWTAIYTFTSPVTPTVEYLVVAGGGAGGFGYYGGGGGAGGYRTATGFSVSAGTPITITIGAGGSPSSGVTVQGGNGQNSVFSSITSIGGGGGGSRNNSYTGGAAAGANGGSGGGTSYGSAGGTGTVGQGNNGGGGTGAIYGASGGGAGAAGTGATSTVVSNGGIGLQSSISGTATYYAGGGGGGKDGPISSGGLGGGGKGGNYQGTLATAGAANTGGGGGGAGFELAGASGGSGIVIIRYADTYPAATSTTGSPTVTVAGGYRVYTFTASGTITF